MKDARRIGEIAANAQPVIEVVAHVVPAEREHGHRVAPHLADLAGGGGGRFGAHRRAEIDAVNPVEGLEDERHRRRAAPAEDDRADRHAMWIMNLRRQRGVVRHGRGEARVGMRRLFLRIGRPRVALPIDEPGGRRFILAFPPHVAIGRQRRHSCRSCRARSSASRSDSSSNSCRARRRSNRPRD